MKKLLMLLTILFFSLLAIGQKTSPDTTKMSNYEKYLLQQGQISTPSPKINKDTVIKKKEWDDIYFNSKTDKQVKKNKKHRDDVDQIVDTIVQENPGINVNYYYNYDDPFFYSYSIGRFYHGGFNYWMYSDPWIYNNYFGMMDINDWYWEYRFLGYPYWLYPEYNYLGLMLWGGPWEYGRYNYWNPWRFNHNHWNPWRFNNDQWNHGSYPYYGNNLHQNNPGNTKYRHIEATSSSSVSKRVSPPQSKSVYSANRRAYTPSYNAPSRNVRPEYNNSRASMPVQRSSTRNANPTYNNSRSSGSSHRSESRAYSVPSRSQNSSYSSGSRGSNSYSPSSNYSRSSSSGSNYNSSSSSSSSSNSRSSGGSSSGRR